LYYWFILKEITIAQYFIKTHDYCAILHNTSMTHVTSAKLDWERFTNVLIYLQAACLQPHG